MAVFHAVVTTGIGYGTPYGADTDRDVGREAEAVGVPARLVARSRLAWVRGDPRTRLTAPGTVLPRILVDRGIGVTTEAKPRVTQAVGVGAIVAVVGAATADSVFWQCGT